MKEGKPEGEIALIFAAEIELLLGSFAARTRAQLAGMAAAAAEAAEALSAAREARRAESRRAI